MENTQSVEEIVVDPETGLPQVPEDMFWKITDSGCGLVVTLMKRKIKEYEIEVEEETGFFHRLFYGVNLKTEMVPYLSEFEVRGKVMRHTSTINCKGRRNAAEMEATGMVKNGWTVCYSNEDYIEMEKPQEPTPESVLKTAMGVYSGYLKEKEEDRLRDEMRKKAEKFVGEYPPKKI